MVRRARRGKQEKARSGLGSPESHFFSRAGTLGPWHRHFRADTAEHHPRRTSACIATTPAVACAMPPRIPVRVPWPCAPAAAPTAPVHSWSAGASVRALSSSAPAQALGPQSPNYIDVPKPLQPSYPPKPSVQGHLPVPRDIFKTRSRHPKQSSVFLNRSTRTPKDPKQPGPHSRDADLRLYKQRLAEKRREALREGISQLHERKVATEAEYLAKIQAQGVMRRDLALAPRRPVDILTDTSVSKGVRDFLADALPPRQDNTEARRRAYERRVAKYHAVRTSRLHDLYINAREFIVEESQLDEAIDKAFGTEESPIGWNMKGKMGPRAEGNDGLSPWQGPIPEGVSDMLQKLKGGEGIGLARQRVRQVAEELTGGRL